MEESIMKEYSITVSLEYGSITIDNIEAFDESEAFDKACDMLRDSVDFATLEEVVEY